jgi:hypothetical protein
MPTGGSCGTRARFHSFSVRHGSHSPPPQPLLLLLLPSRGTQTPPPVAAWSSLASAFDYTSARAGVPYERDKEVVEGVGWESGSGDRRRDRGFCGSGGAIQPSPPGGGGSAEGWYFCDVCSYSASLFARPVLCNVRSIGHVVLCSTCDYPSSQVLHVKLSAWCWWWGGGCHLKVNEFPNYQFTGHQLDSCGEEVLSDHVR